ncbi:MAG: hypothetical protein QNK79_05605 [Synechococcus sp. ArSW.bin.68]|jgi:hypothetical protein
MIRTTLTAAALALGSLAAPAMADSTKAYCTLAWDDTSKGSIQGPCTFSQYSGNVYIDNFDYYKFAFPAAEQGKTYQRDTKEVGISFSRKGQYTLNVFWAKPLRELGGY